jgi:MFS family permease
MTGARKLMPSPTVIPILRNKPLKPYFLVSSALLYWASLYTYPSILSPYLNSLQVSLPLTGVVIGSYGLTQTVLRLPAGILSDRLRNKKAFIIGGLILTLGSALGLFCSSNILLILLFRGMAGAAAAVWVHFSTLYLSYYSPESAAPAMGRLTAGVYFSQMLALLGGSYLAEYLGWRYTFLLAASLAVPSLILGLKIVENQSEAEPGAAKQALNLGSMLSIGKDRLLFWSSILALLLQLVIYASTMGFVPQYAVDLGASKAAIGWMAAFSFVPRSLAALLGGGVLARWFRLRTLTMIGFVLLGSATILLPLVDNMPLLFVDQFVSGIGAGLASTVLIVLCTQTIPLDRKASAMGFFQAVYGIGMVIGPVLVGFLAGIFNLETGFLVVGGISLITAVLTLLVL